MKRHIHWFKFPATPSTLYLLDPITSKLFNIDWINFPAEPSIFVGSHSKQNLQHYMNRHICRIKFPAKASTWYSLDHIPSNTCNIGWIEFLARPSTLYDSTYVLDQIPSRFSNIRFVGSNAKQDLQHYMNQHSCWITFPAKPSTLYDSTYLLD